MKTNRKFPETDGADQEIEFTLKKDLTIQRRVAPAISVKNPFTLMQIPSSIGLGRSGFNNGHQDSFASDTLSLSGPANNFLSVSRYTNPLGGLNMMCCTGNNIMLGTSYVVTPNTTDLFLAAFDAESVNPVGSVMLASLPHGNVSALYFFLNHEDNVVTVNPETGTITCWETGSLTKSSPNETLTSKWESESLLDMVYPGSKLQSVIPVGDPEGNENQDLYWVMLGPDNGLGTDIPPTIVKLVQINDKGVVTNQSFQYCHGYHNNNTLTSEGKNLWVLLNQNGDEDGQYDLDAEYTGLIKCYSLSDTDSGNPTSFEDKHTIEYPHVGFLKAGMSNVGSGTTVTISQRNSEEKLVSFLDNAEDYSNLHVYKLAGGAMEEVTPSDGIPFGRKRRSASEASIAAYGEYFLVSSNFGHTSGDMIREIPQGVPNEPGIALYRIDEEDNVSLVWEANLPINTSFGMPQIDVTNGVIYVFTGLWKGDEFVIKENGEGDFPNFYLSAYDAHDGRIIWQLPLGNDYDCIHEYGGAAYQSQQNIDNALFIGGARKIYKIANVDPTETTLQQN